MQRLAWLLVASYTGLAHAQSSQPSSAPAEPTSAPVEATPLTPTIVASTVITPSEALPQIQPTPKAEPIPPKRASLPEIHALLQAWYDSQPRLNADDTFRVRRAEFRVSGELIPKRVKYNVMADLAKEIIRDVNLTFDEEGNISGIQEDDDALLEDAILSFVLPNASEVLVGQYKIPLSLEGYGSTARLLFPERSIVSRNFGNERDMGVSLLQRKERYMYAFGLFNGNGLNQLDNNDTKDIVGRFEVYPKKGLLIGAAMLSEILNEEGSQKTRFELDVKYEQERLVFVSEIFMATDEDQPSAGAYVAGMVPLPFDERLQLGARYSLLAPDLRAASGEEVGTLQEFSAGANFYLKDNQAKLQASISRFLDLDPEDNFTQIILAGQASF